VLELHPVENLLGVNMIGFKVNVRHANLTVGQTPCYTPK